MFACFGVNRISNPKLQTTVQRSIYPDNFPLEAIHSNLQSHILEKMLYPDFATFNACSSFSSKMTEQLPQGVKLILEARNIVISDTQGKIAFGTMVDTIVIGKEVFQHYEKCDKEQRKVNFGKYNKLKFRLHCSFLTVYRYGCLDVMDLFAITTNSLQLVYLRENVDFIDALLKMTKAKVYRGSASSTECLELETIRKVSDLHIDFANYVDNKILLGLEAPIMSISGRSNITPDGLADFLKQWKSGHRQIQHIHLNIFESGPLSIDVVRHILGEDGYTNDQQYPNQIIYLCRTTDHKDCIKVGIHSGWNRWISISKVECPNKNCV